MVAEKIANNVLSLPLYGELKEEDIHKICDVINYFYQISDK
jgi:dTDP-4-amino-4,6-dideoxygalactose transaminase